MTTIRVIGHVDESHRLLAEMPANVLPGTVEVLVRIPGEDEDEAGKAWMGGISFEWEKELGDPREDIYSIHDGEPVNRSTTRN